MGRKMGCEDEKASWATGKKLCCAEGLGQKREVKRREKKFFLPFQKSSQNLNSNTNLNSNKYKQCISMSATVNSYSSLI
jgi:hypothetical protein